MVVCVQRVVMVVCVSVQQVDVDSVASPEDLEVLGLARLKDELVSRGCKCGGTLKERAARLYSVRGLRPEQIDPLLRAKTSAKDKKKKK